MDAHGPNSGPGDGGGANPSGDKPARPADDPGAYSQQISHSPISARVPERVARGVLSTGVIVLDGPNEFVVDFLQGLGRPAQIVARVVIPPAVMQALIASGRDNLGKYIQRFGPPPVMPKPTTPQRPSIQELYEHFKLPEELLSGVYANSILIGHSPAEFVFDFITNFYPTSAVAARVYLAAPQVPRVLDTLAAALQQYQRRYAPKPPGGGEPGGI